MVNWRDDRLGAAEQGENPTVLARMRSGFVTIGDTQFLPGYCLLLASPRVGNLSDLPLSTRLEFLRDMSLLGEAIEAVCRPKRINYEIFGNTDPFLHAHVLPRYDWEPVDYLSGPASHYPREKRGARRYQFSEETHGELKARIGMKLLELMEGAGARVS